MKPLKLLSLGWISATFFIVGSIILGSQLEDYSAISQTISEIGESGSPLSLHWKVFTLGIGSMLILFAMGIISFARKNSLSIVPGLFILSYGISEFGIGFFPSPHSLHNVFGLSMTIGYFSPLVFALVWKNKLGNTFKITSWVAFILIILGIFLNLSPAFAPSLFPLEYYGIVQRFLLYVFFLYCGYISLRIINSIPAIKGV